MFGNEARRRTWPPSPSGSAARSSTRTARPRAASPSPRPPGTPAGALGRLDDGHRGARPGDRRPRCPPRDLDEQGRLRNPDEAIGELVRTSGAGAFAGYYNDPAADADRLRDGMFWSGDLVYRDAQDYCYFVGRAGEWLRVAGENLGAAPIERILLRHPDVAEAAVYAVPDAAGRATR